MTSTTHQDAITPVDAWDAIAHSYDEHVAAGEADVAEAGLRLVGLRAGQTFLDVCAGTGGLGLPAARLGAKVLATVWSPKMIERFTARATSERLDAEARVMDCHSLDLDEDTFDVTGSQFGVMLVPDQARAIREMVRVTRPGGRVLLTAYGDPSQFEALQFFLSAVQAVVPASEGLTRTSRCWSSRLPMLEFQVADPEVLRKRLVDAGVRDVIVDTAQRESVEVRSGKQLWDWTLGSNPVPGMLVAELTDAQRHEVVAVLDGMVMERADRHGVAVLAAPLNIAVGTK